MSRRIPAGDYVEHFDPELPHHRAWLQAVLERLVALEPDLVSGATLNANGMGLRFSRRNFGRRWMVEPIGGGPTATPLEVLPLPVNEHVLMLGLPLADQGPSEWRCNCWLFSAPARTLFTSSTTGPGWGRGREGGSLWISTKAGLLR
jgi:hypothetical protein